MEYSGESVIPEHEHQETPIICRPHEDYKCVCLKPHGDKKEVDTKTESVATDENYTILSSSSSCDDLTPWIPIHLVIDDNWDDNLKPCIRLIDYGSLKLNDDEKEGILSEQVLATGLSHLSRSPGSKGFIMAKLHLSNKNLKNIDIVRTHHFLQYMDLSRNHLTDVSCLGRLPYLMHLNLSYNELTSVLGFQAPLNLTYVNYSHNKIEKIGDLSDFWSIRKLNLSNNNITKIEGLSELRYLQYLNLSFNKIACFENLNNLRIVYLFLENNCISSHEEGPDVGMKTMLYLNTINLSNNNLTTLALFKNVYHMHFANISNNQITELMEVEHLSSMLLLSELRLTNNPLTQLPKYRCIVCRFAPSITVLDGTKIQVAEKVSARNIFTPNIGISVARTYARLLLMEQLNYNDIDLDVIPVDQGAYPLVVLVGPPGCKKGHLVRTIVELFPQKVYAGVSHTSRKKEPDEVDGLNYHFVSLSKFDELACNGSFLAVTETIGNSYGFSRTELAKAVEQHRLCITHMDLIGAMTLCNQGLEPHLVLIITESEDIHLNRLRLKYMGWKEHRSSGAVEIRRNTGSERESSLEITHPQLSQQMLKGENIKQLINKICSKDYKQLHKLGILTAEEEEESVETYRNTPHSNNSINTETNMEMLDDQNSTATADEYTQNNEDHALSQSECGVDGVEGEASKCRASGSRTSVSVVECLLENTFQEVIGSKCNNRDSVIGSKGNKSDSELLKVKNKDKNYSEKTRVCSLPVLRSHLESTEEDAHDSSYEELPSTNSVENVEDLYIRPILKSRILYLTIHDKNPGLFLETIYTDNIDKAHRKLVQFVRRTFESRPERRPIFNIENDHLHKEVISEKLMVLLKEIKHQYSN